MEELDGLVLPGGPTLFNLRDFENKGLPYFRIQEGKEDPSSYLFKVTKIIDKVKNINDNGRAFVLYGICLGFQAIMISESENNIRIGNMGRIGTFDKLYLTKEKTQIARTIHPNYVKIMS